MLGSHSSSMRFPAATTTHCSPTFQTLVISSSKFQRRRQRPPQPNDLDEDFGSVGHIVLKSLKSSTPSLKIESVETQPQPDSSRKHQVWKNKKKIEKQGGKPLSGSDVLLALQRATKEKSRSRIIGKGKKKLRTRSDGGSDEEEIDYGDVKEVKLKSDWGDRLDELERLLQELKRF